MQFSHGWPEAAHHAETADACTCGTAVQGEIDPDVGLRSKVVEDCSIKLCIGPEPSPRRLASPQAGKSINEWGR
jgi:hypothetical protein